MWLKGHSDARELSGHHAQFSVPIVGSSKDAADFRRAGEKKSKMADWRRNRF